MGQQITEDIATQMVIGWLNKQDYSKNHWKVVAGEVLERAGGDEKKAVLRLGEELERFHRLYAREVVKSGNLLDDFLGMCLDLVDWKVVARGVW